MHFQRVEDLRVDADKTQQEIADVLHCKREVYRRYEKGIHELPVWALIELAKYYHTTTDYILGLSDKRAGREDGQSRPPLRRFVSLLDKLTLAAYNSRGVPPLLR